MMDEMYNRIRVLRESLNLSQEELAEMIGYTSRSSIAKVETGKVDLTQSKIKAFAEALNTTPAYLMGWTEKSEQTMESIAAKTLISIRNNVNAIELVQIFSNLDEDKQVQLLNIARTFKSSK